MTAGDREADASSSGSIQVFGCVGKNKDGVIWMMAILLIGQKRVIRRFICCIAMSLFDALPAAADPSGIHETTNNVITRRAENRE
jgi:hypothetical protein